MYFQGYDDRERYYRCKICSCYYKRESDIEKHVLENHNGNVLSSISKGVLYTGKCKLCSSELVQGSYNKHLRDIHPEIFFSADRTVAVRGKPKQENRAGYDLDTYSYNHLQYGEASSSRNDMTLYYQETRLNQHGYHHQQLAMRASSSSPRARGSRGRGRGTRNVQINNYYNFY